MYYVVQSVPEGSYLPMEIFSRCPMVEMECEEKIRFCTGDFLHQPSMNEFEKSIKYVELAELIIKNRKKLRKLFEK